ncbi:PWWP domain-containing protein 2B [Ornithorhynchus anatinus]|uniref:PWWP domain-containing protein 2B n=1 Tax=Ornithorhynchus anatinus TaxID=9258 RepID=UPI0010A8C194|nr:PWWP domain-containing protein 2B [Ornithorhynchus anatinus]
MEAVRAGARLPVLVEQVLGDALLVTLRCGARSFTGLLLDCNKKSGLFCLPPPSPPGREDPPPTSGPPWDPPPTSGPPWDPPPTSGPPWDPPPTPPPPPPPLPAGRAPPYPPYFEGAPYPPPLWLRHTYRQWVPQPPPRGLKRSRRRRPSSRPRPPGRLTPSTIRLRPRRVLCQNCQTSLGPDQSAHAPRRRPGPASPSPPARRHGHHRDGPAEPGGGARRGRPERGAARGRAGRGPGRGEAVPRSPVIKISYSTPQGTGEVVEIPSRIHGSLRPFCPPRVPPEPPAPLASVPKLKLTRPGLPPAVPPPPKIRLKPQRPDGGDSAVSVYKAELVGEPGLPPGEPLLGPPPPPAFFPGRASGPGSARASSGSEEDGVDEEEEDEEEGDGGGARGARRFRGFGRGRPGRDDLAFLVNYHKRRADSSGLPVWSNDSLDESKSSSSEAASPAPCDFLPGDDLSVSSSSSSRDERKTVPPLTVRLHTQSVPRCVTEDGRTVSVGDVVWGKIHGFPWWPARILDINLGQKADGDPSWQEAKVSWFGSPTTSFLSVSKLSPFSEFFKLRFNRKKKGLYRKAIAEAAKAADHLSPEIRDLLTQFET